MFDEQNNKVVDIFDGIDKDKPAETAGGTAPRPVNSASPIPPMSPAAAPASKKWFFVAGAAVIIILLLIVFAVAYSKYRGVKEVTDESTVNKEVNSTEQPVVDQPKTEEPLNGEPAAVATGEEEVKSEDSDQDGLTDEEEIAAGSNPLLADTDADGLFDFGEVKKFQTSPVNSDTDGDGFLDGEEVLNGYNPKGSGKLLNFQDELNKIKAEPLK